MALIIHGWFGAHVVTYHKFHKFDKFEKNIPYLEDYRALKGSKKGLQGYKMVHFYPIYRFEFIKFTVSIFIYRIVFIKPQYINSYLSIKTIKAVYRLSQELDMNTLVNS